MASSNGKRTLEVEHWIASSQKAPFSDSQSPTQYSLGSWRFSERVTCSTPLSYQRHLSRVRHELAEDGGRILEEIIRDNGSRVFIYRPGWERGPHASPLAIVIPAYPLTA